MHALELDNCENKGEIKGKGKESVPCCLSLCPWEGIVDVAEILAVEVVNPPLRKSLHGYVRLQLSLLSLLVIVESPPWWGCSYQGLC